jgi:hypothetical protein
MCFEKLYGYTWFEFRLAGIFIYVEPPYILVLFPRKGIYTAIWDGDTRSGASDGGGPFMQRGVSWNLSTSTLIRC